ncbi:MAG: SDR family NAD(P)-dependent oxidoreductase [Candidatus Hodarchaeota archaeon]
MNLKNKTALVTGGSRGIGKAACLKLSREGCEVIVNYNTHRKRAQEVVKKIEGAGGRGVRIKADVSRSIEVDQMVKAIMEEFGHIDVLINNAGILINQPSILDIPEVDWNRTIDVNLKGVFLCSKSVIPHMIRQRRGRIVNVSSIAGKMGGTVGVHYSASKAGIIGLTMALARELAPHNITVNAVAPGVVDTELLPSDFKEQAKNSIPLGRIALPEEVADTILFLVRNGYITGEIVNINGGRYMG